MLIDWLVLSAALLSGLLGGVHCGAMCGAIPTSLWFGEKPASPATQWLPALQRAAHSLGRIEADAMADPAAAVAARIPKRKRVTGTAGGASLKCLLPVGIISL